MNGYEMKHTLTVLTALLLTPPAIAVGWVLLPLCEAGTHVVENSSHRILWYDAAATDWQKEALPIGNGRIGGMIYGGVSKEHIQFNEDSLWIGDEQDTGAYQAFGDVYVDFGHGEPHTYRRELDLDRAVHTITYESEGVLYTREYFASHPAQVMVFRFSANRPGAYTGTITLTDAHEAAITVADNRITAKGDLSGYVYRHGSNRGKEDIHYDIVLDYEAQLLVLHQGGSVAAGSGHIAFNNCDSLTILLAADTDYLNQRDKGWKGEHPHARITAQIDAASEKSYEALLKEHVDDYQPLFSRLVLDLGATGEPTLKQTTSSRMREYRSGKPDPDLEELLFQYARYMMISCSRPGACRPTCRACGTSNRPPWRSDYHTDVNIQMNYWFVDAANLSECFEPLAEWVYSIREVRRDETQGRLQDTRLDHARGKRRLRRLHLEVVERRRGLGGPEPLGPLRLHAGQGVPSKHAPTPFMKELCEFWEDHLKELPDGTLVSPDGFSPEHGPHEDGVSFDQQLVWDLFTNFIEASEALGVDEPFREEGRRRCASGCWARRSASGASCRNGWSIATIRRTSTATSRT